MSFVVRLEGKLVCVFSDVGWGEVFVLFIVGLVVIGPERLPRVIQDVKATLLAMRTAINNAKRSLNNELGTDFSEISKPLSDLAALQRMGPKAMITKTLFDGDNSMLDSLNPKKILEDDSTKPKTTTETPTTTPVETSPDVTPPTQAPSTTIAKSAAQSSKNEEKSSTQKKTSAGPEEGSSWADVT